MHKIRIGSDFSGVGSFNQALFKLNIPYEEVFACDKDKFARQTFIHNYGEPVYFPKDVYDRAIPKEPLDLYVSSPSCQAFSIIGNRRGEKDKRGVLFYNTHEFIKENKPRYFIIENVKGLLSNDKGKTFGKWLDCLGGKSINGISTTNPSLESAPYHIHYKVLNSTDFNVPQNRERVFIVGIRDDKDNNFVWPSPVRLNRSLWDFIEEEVPDKYFLSYKMINGFLNKNNQFNGRFKPKTKIDTIANCITATYYKIQITGTFLKVKEPTSTCSGIRRLTPREAFRLMGFPESFSWPVSNTQAYKQAGNSIVVDVLTAIINNLKLSR